MSGPRVARLSKKANIRGKTVKKFKVTTTQNVSIRSLTTSLIERLRLVGLVKYGSPILPIFLLYKVGFI